MYVLVTGANGTVGRVLCDVLELAGHTVTRSGVELLDKPGYKPMDILYPDSVYDTLRPMTQQVVIHLGAEMGIKNGEYFPHRMIEANVLGTLNIVNACKQAGMRLIYVSSSDVYGRLFDEGPVSEDMDIPASAPKNIYALAKLMSEQVVRHSAVTTPCLLRDPVIIRPVMLYGPGELPTQWRSALIRMCRAEVEGDQFFIHEGARRGWLYYEDFARAILCILEAMKDGKEAHAKLPYDIYNIGNDDYRTLDQLHKVVRSEMDRLGMKCRGIIVNQHGESLDRELRSMDKVFSYDRIHELGWKPCVPLETGVRQVLKTFKGCC